MSWHSSPEERVKEALSSICSYSYAAGLVTKPSPIDLLTKTKRESNKGNEHANQEDIITIYFAYNVGIRGTSQIIGVAKSCFSNAVIS